jgi:hypothetical protein
VDPAGEADRGALRLDFDRRLMLQFRGSAITSDGLFPLNSRQHHLAASMVYSQPSPETAGQRRLGAKWQSPISSCATNRRSPGSRRIWLLATSDGASLLACPKVRSGERSISNVRTEAEALLSRQKPEPHNERVIFPIRQVRCADVDCRGQNTRLYTPFGQGNAACCERSIQCKQREHGSQTARLYTRPQSLCSEHRIRYRQPGENWSYAYARGDRERRGPFVRRANGAGYHV